MNKIIPIAALTLGLILTLLSPQTNAATYIIDHKGAHASINFKVKHIGYSWLTGRFDKFTGHFTYDPANISASTIEVSVDTSSINSNHAERDKHLKGSDFLDVTQFAKAHFVSTKIIDKGMGQVSIEGNLSLHGVSKSIVIDAQIIGEGDDPWGGYRAGFSGTSKIGLKDFGINYNLGPHSSHVELELYIEGVRR